MATFPKIKLHRAIPTALFISLITFSIMGAGGTSSALARGAETPNPQISIANSAYFTSKTITMADGTLIDEYIINGPPTPIPGYETQRRAVTLPKPDYAMGTVTLPVPAFDWSFGCSATSGAMIAAYYDRNGFPNMYTGPTNGGVMPIDSSVWPDWVDGAGKTYGQCPLTASHLGLDGRATRGSIDDYWVAYGSTAPDPYITNHWTEHTYGDAIGDYMRTSQSAFGNSDGSTVFYNYSTKATPLTCAEMAANNITIDGTYGRKLFYETKGYTVTDCYNQKTDNNGGGFTFAMYKAEIDAGRPVMLNLDGHTIVGIGYDDSTNTVYIHDTWDYATHYMTWGGGYGGMNLLSVSIVNFTGGTLPPGAFNKSAPANNATGISFTPTLSWTASSGATLYQYCYDTTNDNDCSSWTSNGAATSVALSGLIPGTTYYWQVRAYNGTAGPTLADAGAFWSFTTGAKPAPFTRTIPANGATGVSLNPTLSWGTSTGATSYTYCYDTTNDNACSNWISNGTSTSKALSGLALNTTYYWHVRAVNSFGTTYADGDSPTVFWSFTTGNKPGAFNKMLPANGANEVSNSPTLSWGASTGATSYEYCYDTTNDNACSSWTSNAAATTTALDGLNASTPYYWQVRAVNDFGTTYANGSAAAFWSFTTSAQPGSFDRTGPANGATGVSLSPTLSWGASTGATSYEYCYDTTNDNACTAWTNNGTSTSKDLSGLALNATYYWHVRALNNFGPTYADGDSATTFWSFTTGDKPGAFNKTQPADGATIVVSAGLSWAASARAASYEYCYGTTNDNSCSGWASNGTATSKTLSGLNPATTYYWQVRALNSFGTTDADGDSATAFWSFTVVPAQKQVYLPVILK